MRYRRAWKNAFSNSPAAASPTILLVAEPACIEALEGQERDDLRMGGGIAQLLHPVAGSRQDLAAAGIDKNGAHRHFAPRRRSLRLLQGQVHHRLASRHEDN